MPPKGSKKGASPTKASAGQSPSKQQLTSAGFPVRQAESVLSNYDLECSSRREELQRTMQSLLAGLRRRTEAELDKLPASIHDLSVKDFFALYNGDIKLASQGIVADQMKEQAQRDQEAVEAQSPKKRKRPAESPSVPPSPALPKSKRFQSSAPIASTSTLPTTNGSSRPIISRPTAKRRPNKNETVQAYSLNGSPLTTVPPSHATISEQPTRNGVPSGEFTFSLTMDSLTRGLREELSKTEMSESERRKLEKRLLNFMQDFASQQ